MEYVSGEEIIQLAKQIKELAIKRRSEELQWAPKGAVPDSQFQHPDFNHNIVRGGTTADYRLLEGSYDWIVEAFQNAIGPEPSGLDGAIQGMDAVREKLRGTADRMAVVARVGGDGKVLLVEESESRDTRPGELKDQILARLGSWQGGAARTFKEKFAIPLPGVIANQVLMVSAIRSGLSANRTVYAMAREDLKGLARATVDALNFKNGSGGPSFAMTLSVAAGVLAVTAACVSGPGAIVFLTAASSAAGVAKDVVDSGNVDRPKSSGKEFRIGGHTVDDILSTTYDLIRETQKCVAASEDTIIQGLRQNFDALTEAVSRKEFVSPRPAVADARTSLSHVRDEVEFFPG